MSGCLNCSNEARPGAWLCEKCDPPPAQAEPVKDLGDDWQVTYRPKGLIIGQTQQSFKCSVVNDPTHFSPEEIMDQNVSALHQPGSAEGTDKAPDTVEHVWNNDTLRKISEYGDLITNITKKREALNTQKAAGKASLVAIGFNNESLTAALSYANTPEKDRLNWDESYIFARKALGCPLQEDLFMAAMAETVTVEAPAPKGD